MSLGKLDRNIIRALRKFGLPAARIALFIVFFWFGFLKIIDASPANPLVESLLRKTLPFLSFESFIAGFGLYEMAIGLFFIIPGLERLAIALLVPHMIATFLPLVFLPEITWKSFLIPTLEGQYIIKNFVIVALAFSIGAHLHPLGKDE